jgi:hypothetical protein
MKKTYPTLSEVLRKLVGTAVVSVDFVEDYVQLVWEKSFLTAYTMPAIVTEGVKYCKEDTEYRQAMYRLEGQVVERAEVVGDEAVSFLFMGGTLLSISIQDVDHAAPEALLYQEIGGLLRVA